MTPSPLSDGDIADRTDAYFNRTREIVTRFGDATVTYAIFLRRPVVCAPAIMVDWLQTIAKARGQAIEIELPHKEGEWVGAGEPLAYVTGSFIALSDLETLALQKIGPACVAAHNAFQMAVALPHAAFMAMEARHCAGAEMQEIMAYACAVGSRAAQTEGAIGFIGNANDWTAHYFGAPRGYGTMPHALIGYAGSTLRAAEMFVETFPDEPLTVLVDYFGREVTDALEVCQRFSKMAAAGKVSVRLDTHGGRYLEGMGPQESYEVLERNAPGALRRYRSQRELGYLIGTGVSAASVWKMREALNEAGFPSVKIVASSGFGVEKCSVMADAKAPIDLVGTGSFIPENWSETYATADIVAYNGVARVKIGREFLLRHQNASR